MSRRSRSRHLWQSAGVLTVLVASASCGARSGLFVPDDQVDIIVDASITIDGGFSFDGSTSPLDASADVVEEPVGCVPGTFAFTPATSQLMFVLDRSRSMTFSLDSNNPPPPGEPTRWTSLRDALQQTILPFSSEIAMGARFFPQANAGLDAPAACQQDEGSAAILPALNNAQSILDVFDTTAPAGGTPSAVALDFAAGVSGPRGAVARAMVIATDGAPNCNAALDPNTCTCTAILQPGQTDCSASTESDGSNCLDDTATIQAIQNIFTTRNIPVFVIGIGALGSFQTTLDQMAVAGGRPRAATPRYYPAETPADLTTAFEVVRDSVGKCNYVTPSAPTDPNSITVTLAGVDIPRDPTHTDGWDWVDQDFGQLALYGSACDSATTINVGGTIVCDAPDASSIADASIGD